VDVLKSKKLRMEIIGLVIVAIVSAVCKHYAIGDEITQMILQWIFRLTGLSIVAHGAADVTSMIKGLQKKKEEG